MSGQPRTKFDVKPCIIITGINCSGSISWVFYVSSFLFHCPSCPHPLCLFSKGRLHTRLRVNGSTGERVTVLSSLLHIFSITIQLKIKEMIPSGSYFKRQQLFIRIFMPQINCLCITCPYNSSNNPMA